MKIEVMCQRANWGSDIELVFFSRHHDGMVSIAKPLILEKAVDGAIHEPTVALRNDMAQALIDELWRVGLRPSEGTGSAGSLAATERHLKDMQKIALGLLRAQGVE